MRAALGALVVLVGLGHDDDQRTVDVPPQGDRVVDDVDAAAAGQRVPQELRAIAALDRRDRLLLGHGEGGHGRRAAQEVKIGVGERGSLGEGPEETELAAARDDRHEGSVVTLVAELACPRRLALDEQAPGRVEALTAERVALGRGRASEDPSIRRRHDAGPAEELGEGGAQVLEGSVVEDDLLEQPVEVVLPLQQRLLAGDSAFQVGDPGCRVGCHWQGVCRHGHIVGRSAHPVKGASTTSVKECPCR